MNKTDCTTNQQTSSGCRNVATDKSLVEPLMQQQQKNFYVEKDETGALIYHWVDTRVDMLSISKLWSILSLCEKADRYVDLAFANAITSELIKRNEFETRPKMRIQ